MRHVAVRLRLTSDGDAMMEEELVTSARTLSRNVRESNAYGKDALRNYAVQRRKDDDELQREVAGVDGLFGRLIQVVANPGIKMPDMSAEEPS